MTRIRIAISVVSATLGACLILAGCGHYVIVRDSRGRVKKTTENEIGTAIIECAIDVHRELGPGLLETVYMES